MPHTFTALLKSSARVSILNSEEDIKLLNHIFRNVHTNELSLISTNLDQLTLKNILEDILTNRARIKSLKLDFAGKNLGNDDIYQLSVKLPKFNIKTLKLDLTGTKIC